jgi:MarR family transcriptional regulator, organic hydroperoxide resistance regulator
VSEPAQRASERRLYHQLQLAASHLKSAADRRCHAVVGISASKAGALFAIEQQPGSTQRTLAAVLGVRESAVKTMIDRLEQLGLVERRVNDADSRAWSVFATKQGGDTLAKARRELNTLNRALGRTLGNDVDTLSDALSAVIAIDFDHY